MTEENPIRFPLTDTARLLQARKDHPECYEWINGMELIVFWGELAEAQRNGG